MNPDLEKLIRLQRAESELKRIESELTEIPHRRAELDASLARERQRLDQAREAQSGSQKARRQYESDLQALEAKRSKYKTQLMDVKTNKEYTAMLHEIEGVEREIRSLEDQILVEMERAESLAAEAKTEELAFKQAEQRHAGEARALESGAASLSEAVGRHAAARDAIAATVPADALELFRRVATRRGTAVAGARDGTCLLCHVKLRLQMYVDLKRNDEILQCPSCNRILFYEPLEPVATPGP